MQHLSGSGSDPASFLDPGRTYVVQDCQTWGVMGLFFITFNNNPACETVAVLSVIGYKGN